jgi:deoxyribonuclease-4
MPTETRLLLGAHQSIAGGVHKALELGQEAGCDTVQIFVKTPSRWASKPLDEGGIVAFRDAVAATGIWPVFAHSLYLINLATPDDELWHKSVDALVDDLQRCEQLGLPGLVLHPGSHRGSGEDAGIARVAAGAQVWLETTAGQGDHLGHTFSQLRAILYRLEDPDRVGVCFDTAHAFAAGYDQRTREGYEATWAEFDDVLGLGFLRAIHLNDSRRGLGSRVDRHEQIGQGQLGLEPFRFLVNDPRFRGIPMTLETDKGPDLAEDRENLAILRGLVE